MEKRNGGESGRSMGEKDWLPTDRKKKGLPRDRNHACFIYLIRGKPEMEGGAVTTKVGKDRSPQEDQGNRVRKRIALYILKICQEDQEARGEPQR